MKKIFVGRLAFGVALCLLVREVPAAPTPSPAASPTPSAPLPELPAGPLLRSAPDRSRWAVSTVLNEPVDPKAKAKPKAKKKTPAPKTTAKKTGTILGEKAGNVVHVSTTTDNGVEERWSDGKMQMTTNAAWKIPLFSTGVPQEFPRPDWISRKNFREVRKEGDRVLWVFHDRIFPDGEIPVKDPSSPDTNPDDLKVDVTAVIDAQARLPVSVESTNAITTYKFERMTAGVPLEMPYEIRKAISDREFDSSYRSPDSAAGNPAQQPPRP